MSRVDAAIDFDAPGVWDSLLDKCLEVAEESRLAKRQAGDWIDPHQRPGEGRTLYLGSKSSSVQARLYEKGRQLPLAGRPDWVRCELEVRPQKAAKTLLAGLSPRECWGTSAWSQELLYRLCGAQVPNARVIVWQEPDGERALRAMVRQYGRTLENLAAAHSWEDLGLVLRERLIEQRALNGV